MTARGRLRAVAAALLSPLTLGAGAALLTGVITGRTTSAREQGYEPRELAPHGDFVHPTAGFVLPERAGDFRRVAVTQFDEGATNIAAGYLRAAEGGAVWPISATVYVYPVRGSGDIDEYFTRLLADIGRQHGGVAPDFRQHATLCGGRFVGRYAAFGLEEPFFGVKRPLRSFLVLYRWRDWWVKWRVTTPAPADGEPVSAMVKLTETVVPQGDMLRRRSSGALTSDSTVRASTVSSDRAGCSTAWQSCVPWSSTWRPPRHRRARPSVKGSGEASEPVETAAPPRSTAARARARSPRTARLGRQQRPPRSPRSSTRRRAGAGPRASGPWA